MVPFLCVTIACGAVSGFHALVSSGTTVKQLDRETDALPIGYGGMLTEAALAVLVIVACVAGLNASEWSQGGTYASWSGIRGGGLAVQLRAMFHGGAAFLSHLYIPESHGRTLLAVTVVAFALTTLDSATRLLRFNVEEICRSLRLDFLANRYFASLVAVGGIAFFAVVPAGKVLWTLFGTTNQLLAGLTLLTVSVFLYKISRPIVYTLVPMVLMLAMSMWAMIESIPSFWSNENLSVPQAWSLTVVSWVVLAMSAWLILEGVLSFTRGRGGLDLSEEKPEPLPAEELVAPPS
jgi:carbon starvation protein